MILLLGGTTQTAALAERLAACGYRVLVSRATDIPLAIGQHANIESRTGPLDDDGLTALLRDRGIRVVVDATHPYATAIRQRARRVAESLGIPYVTFVRPTSIDAAARGVEFAADHATAARLAFAHGKPVLLTTGSRHLSSYVDEARRTATPLVVRVLDHADSLAACHEAGLADDQIVVGRGPFSVEENRRLIQRFAIGVLVTKDGGQSGGTLEKLAAARAEECRVVVVGRPEPAGEGHFESVDAVVDAVRRMQMGS